MAGDVGFQEDEMEPKRPNRIDSKSGNAAKDNHVLGTRHEWRSLPLNAIV